MVVQEGRKALNDGVGTGDLLGTTSCRDWWFAHDLSVSQGARGLLRLNS